MRPGCEYVWNELELSAWRRAWSLSKLLVSSAPEVPCVPITQAAPTSVPFSGAVFTSYSPHTGTWPSPCRELGMSPASEPALWNADLVTQGHSAVNPPALSLISWLRTAVCKHIF